MATGSPKAKPLRVVHADFPQFLQYLQLLHRFATVFFAHHLPDPMIERTIS